MKTINIYIPAFLIMLIFSTSSNGQQFSSGLKGGFNFSTLYIEDVKDQDIRPGFHIGIYDQTKITENLGLQLEALYTTSGNKTYYDNGIFSGEANFNLNYIQVPAMLDFKIGNQLDLNGGIYGAYLVGANSSYDGDLINSYSELDRDNFNKVDYGLVAGLGWNIDAVQIGVRYNLGLQKIAKSSSANDLIGDSKNVVGQIYLAVDIK